MTTAKAAMANRLENKRTATTASAVTPEMFDLREEDDEILTDDGATPPPTPTATDAGATPPRVFPFVEEQGYFCVVTGETESTASSSSAATIPSFRTE